MNFSQYRQRAQEGLPLHLDSSRVPRRARGFQGQPAGFITRLVASCLDVALVYVLVTAFDLSLRILDLVGTPFVTVPIPSPQLLIGIGFVAFWAYCTWAWTSLGRTLGGHVMGLRVANASGGGLGAKRAGLRAVAIMAFPPGLLWVPFSRRGHSLQDSLLATQVIYDWSNQIPDSTR
jgi:uncharacterized RDD family membrane protein YckC